MIEPVRIAHLGSIHCGEPTFRPRLLADVVAQVNSSEPDVVLVAGDLTASGYAWEYEEAVSWLAQLTAPTVVVPGNHDSRNVGYVHFLRHFGGRFLRRRLELEPLRSERLRLSGITVVGLDSSQPDLEEGHIGREWYVWIREQFDRPDDLKILLLHHHVLPIPGSGREMSVVNDAGDVLTLISDLEVDIVLTGHRHVPFFWSLGGTLVANCSTAATARLRGLVPPSWNELRVDASTVKAIMRYPDGRAELTALHSRSTREQIREALFVTDEFFALNHLDAAVEG
ncbi:MAG: metallophosphoesterase [Egibacteraceae bacterium]